MALITCSECGQQISDAATTCPHCGHPRRGASAGGVSAALRSRVVQIGSLLIGVTIASSMAPPQLSSAERLGQGIDIVIVAVIFSALVMAWKRATRGYIPLLALLIALPLATVLDSSDLGTSPSISGEWSGSDPVRTYSFALEEQAEGSITDLVEYTQPGAGMERVQLTGSRLGRDVLIRLDQTEHTPWVFTGRLLDDGRLTGTWSVGDMVLGQLSLTRR